MTYDDFLALVGKEAKSNPELRYTQIWFNMLSTYRSEIAHKIISTPLDPFHKDYVSDDTHIFVETIW